MPSGSPNRPSESAAGLVARNFLTLGSGEALARLIAFGGTIYVARTLGATSYGVLSFALAVYLYLGRLGDAGIEQGLGLREVAAEPGDRTDLVSTLGTFRLLFSIGLGLLLALLGLTVVPEPDGSVLAVIGVLLAIQGGNLKWVHLGLERTRIVAVARTAGEALMVIGVLLLVRDAGDVGLVPLAQAAGDTLLVLWLAFALRARGLRPVVSLELGRLRALAPRAGPLMLSALLGLVIFNSDLLFLRFFRDAAHVGYYAAAYGLISFLINLGGAYNQSLLPTLTRTGRAPAERIELFHTSTAHVFAITAPAILGLWWYAPQVIDVIFGDEYALAVPALAWLAWSVLFLLVRGVPNVALLALGREDRVFQINLAATVLNLALNLTLIPPFGILGAALSTFFTELARLIIAFALTRAEGLPTPGLRRLVKPAVAGGAMMGVLAASGWDLWVGAPLGAVCYLVVLTGLGGVRWSSSRPPSLHV